MGNNNSLNLYGLLKDNRDEILKAETGALLFNLGKSHVGIWGNYFTPDKDNFKATYGYEIFTDDYRDYWEKKKEDGNRSPFEIDLENINKKLKDFFDKQEVKIYDKNENLNKIKLTEVLKCSNSSEEVIKKVFFNGCENINSGIDKGSPKKDQQLKCGLWIANAFGSYLKEVKISDLDKARLSFFKSLHCFFDKNNHYDDPDWKEIRNFVFKEIKNWYLNLLSDSRFPINDVTLWDQAYMTATMFKAVLAGMFLDSSKAKGYIEKPWSIKWRVLGIQYDKLILAEKGLKPAYIQWYREVSDEIDNEVKKIIELDYSLGNEIYRDETGIYFIVPENIASSSDGGLVELRQDLEEIKKEILNAFKKKTEDEFYPAIFLTKESRGLMNLTYLLENTKENFLKVDLSLKEQVKFEKDKNYMGICQICGTRPVEENDKRENEDFVCSVCYERGKGRVDKWFKNAEGDTIWTGELQDEKGRIALVTLKFELGEWLNGDLLNSLLIRQEDYQNMLEEIRIFIETFLSSKPILNGNYNWIDEKIGYLEEELSNENRKELSNDMKPLLGKTKGNLKGIKEKLPKLKELIEKLRDKLPTVELKKKVVVEGSKKENVEKLVEKVHEEIEDILDKNILKKCELLKTSSVINDIVSELEVLIDELKYLLKGRFFLKDLAEDAYGGCKHRGESFNDCIRQIFFGSIAGTKWETLIKDKNHFLNSKIDWEREIIKWEELEDKDIKFLAELILQFLLRKHPSPARLRRIWESVLDFIKRVRVNILSFTDINSKDKSYRAKRLVFKVDDSIEEGEYKYGNLDFWVKDSKAYLITSLADAVNYIAKDPYKLKEAVSNNNEEEAKRFLKDIKLRKYNDKNKKFTSIKGDDLVKIQTYKPVFLIMEPTPVSWQFAIPADTVPTFIENVQRFYYENFKWVYGKLSFHLGVIIQDYKKPLYVGIKALRNIRRDIEDWEKIKVRVDANSFNTLLEDIFSEMARCEEITNDTKNFYSLYEGDCDNEKLIYLEPESQRKEWKRKNIYALGTIKKFSIYPNTVDFEFLDINTRRNDIYYSDKDKKRTNYLKNNRPYTWEEWRKFKLFREIFDGESARSRLNNLITLIYSKLQDWNVEEGANNNLETFKELMLSAFINILELDKYENIKKKILEIFSAESMEKLRNMKNEEFISKIKMFLDMYDFWYKALKEG